MHSISPTRKRIKPYSLQAYHYSIPGEDHRNSSAVPPTDIKLPKRPAFGINLEDITEISVVGADTHGVWKGSRAFRRKWWKEKELESGVFLSVCFYREKLATLMEMVKTGRD